MVAMVTTGHVWSSGTRLLLAGLCLGIVFPSNVAQIAGCGVRYNASSDRDGTAPSGGWPWQASIRTTGQKRHLCSGTIIDRNWILTTAYCVFGLSQRSISVAVGNNDILDLDNVGFYGISQIIVHPDYNPGSFRSGFDLALIRLAYPLIYNQNVAPVCLSPGYGVPSTPCYTTGWNTSVPAQRSNQLQQAETPILKWHRCRATAGPNANLYIQVCARKTNEDPRSCNLDVGSPLVCKRQGREKYDLWGVASWKIGCGQGFVYNLIVTLKPWIIRTMDTATTTTSTTSTTTPSTTTTTTTTTTPTPTTTPTIAPTPTPTTTTTTTTTAPTASPTPEPTTVSISTSTTQAPSVLTDADCGVRFVSRIVGGDLAKPHSWPWMVSLQNRTTGHHYCGGSLIASKWILTAAHCVYGRAASDIQVEIGAHDVVRHDGRIMEVKDIFIPRDFVPFPMLDHDIALILLPAPVNYKQTVLPLCLPAGLRQPSGTCFTAGWGFTTDVGPISNKLRQLVSPIQNMSVCSEYSRIYFPSSNRICSGSERTGTCGGDSGGPLMCPKNGKYEIVGVTSFGLGTCTDLTGNTRVAAYTSWIRHQTDVQCGKRFISRIVGGVTAPAHSWPWMVSIQFRYGQYFCSGVVIHPRWILTAAHCVQGLQPIQIQVETGLHNIKRQDGKIVDVIDIIPHPDYKPYRYKHDIALVKLAAAVPYDVKVHPVCLPPEGGQPSGTCYTTAWGFTSLDGSASDSLQQVRSPVQNDTVCSQQLYTLYNSTQVICAGTQTTGTCNGDSGGPLVCPRAGRYSVWGITSFGAGSCTGVTGYTRITYYLSWIRKYIES